MRPIVTVLALVLSGSACSSSEGLSPMNDSSEAGVVPPPAGDAGVDATLPEAGPSVTAPRRCTDDAWCPYDLPDEKLLDVWGNGEGIAWIASESGKLLRWDGTRWQTHFTSSGALLAIWGSSPIDLWAGGAEGLFHGDGTRWERVDLGEEVTIEDIAGVSANDIWAVGRASTDQATARVFHLTDEWRRDPDVFAGHELADELTDARSVWLTRTSDVWITGALINPGVKRDFLFRRSGAAPTWMAVPLPAEFGRTSFQQAFSGFGSLGDDVWLLGIGRYGPRGSRSRASYWTAPSDGIQNREDWTMGSWRHPLDLEGDLIERYGLWGLSSDDLWVVGGSPSPRAGRIEHWDGSAWTTQRVSRDGHPLTSTLLRAIWGRTNDDIWVVGDNLAAHKVSKEDAERMNAEHTAKDGTP